MSQFDECIQNLIYVIMQPVMLERSRINGIQTVIIGNNREYFSPIDPHVPAQIRDEFVQADIDEADMDIMWHGDNKIVFLPDHLDPAFVSDITQLFHYRNAHIFTPHDSGVGLSQNILRDPQARNLLTDALRDPTVSQVIPWGHTPEYEKLVGKLDEEGLIFSTPETPGRSALWTPEYIDTKVGSREILLRARAKNPNIKVPEGFVCADLDSAVQISQYFLGTNRGVVFKANIGGAGIGVNVFPPIGFDSNTDDNHRIIESKVRENPLFQSGPVIVEEYIPADFSQHGVFPSVDGLVRPQGEVAIQAVDAMVIHHEGESVGFYGCVLGKGLFTDEQSNQLRHMSQTIGEELAALGYRGWYDVDYILSQSGDMYTTECNLRRTSICYMLDLAELLFGEDYEQKMAMRSNDKYMLPNLQGLSYGDLKEILAPVMYPMNQEQRGIVITQSFRSMYGRGKFGYVSIGADQDDTRAIEMKLDGILTNV